MQKEDSLFITKASGSRAGFSEEKLRRSLRKTGATEEQAKTIITEVVKKLYPGISTKKIYRYAFNLLKEHSGHLAARYHLKIAIMELGPSGYPFEKYIADILQVQGYTVRVDQIIQGQCVNHEIDVIATKDQNYCMIECKYHNRPGIFCDVKIPLYIQSRFKDVEALWLKLPDHAGKFHQGWVITNTRFSTDAIQYGNCIGLKLLSWDYPHKGSLKELIDSLGLYPITCLTTLSKYEKQYLLDRKIVLCKEVADNEQQLLNAGVEPARINVILTESQKLCTAFNS